MVSSHSPASSWISTWRGSWSATAKSDAAFSASALVAKSPSSPSASSSSNHRPSNATTLRSNIALSHPCAATSHPTPAFCECRRVAGPAPQKRISRVTEPLRTARRLDAGCFLPPQARDLAREGLAVEPIAAHHHLQAHREGFGELLHAGNHIGAPD